MVFAAFRHTGSDEYLRPELRRRRYIRSPSSSSSSIPTASRSASTELAAALAATSDAFAEDYEKAADLTDLNNALLALAAIFPDIRPEVLREMLSTFSGHSRLHIVAEQLIKNKAKWVNGRWRVSTRGAGLAALDESRKVVEEVDNGEEPTLVSPEEQFRSESYKQAARTALCNEFRALNRSMVDGVLAEQNYYYTSSRPILQGLAAKSWRNSFSTFLSRWRKAGHEVSDKHFMLLWTKSPTSSLLIPALRESGDKDLDLELRDTVLQPLLEKRHRAQEAINIELATLLNEEEAEAAHALYECECCFSDTTFESMATCTTGTHTICFTCIQHAASEALYGQSWGLNIDHSRGQIACLAPTTTTTTLCEGCIPQHLSHRAIFSAQKGGQQMWQELQSRLADEALLKSQSSLVRCPFCPYAEVDDLYLAHPVRWRLNTAQPSRTFLLLVITSNMLGLLLLYAILAHLFPSHLPLPRHLLSTSLTTLTRTTHLSPRFSCRNPSCARASCLLCKKAWREPHICHESATLSLRTTVEAARTAALKRTCPRCGLGFVKDSGCNKMVCVCGYAMCYICRQGLGRGRGGARNGAAAVLQRVGGVGVEGGVRGARARRQAVGGEELDVGGAGAGDDVEDGEGYRHFCQHFRPAGGQCGECEKCDLYRGENEDEIVKRAGERAEREWREREGSGSEGVTVGGLRGRRVKWGSTGMGRWGWSLQEGVDWWVGAIVRC